MLSSWIGRMHAVTPCIDKMDGDVIADADGNGGDDRRGHVKGDIEPAMMPKFRVTARRSGISARRPALIFRTTMSTTTPITIMD